VAEKTESEKMNKPEQKTKNIKCHLRCEFTEAELLAQGKVLAELSRQAVVLEEEKKRVTDDYKAKMSSIEADISITANNIRTGYEFRNVDCVEFWNEPKAGQKTVVRKDLQKTIQVLDMTQDEMQQTLPLEEPAAP